jgi:hypothetical protein
VTHRRRRVTTLGELAAGAAQGKRVVLSVGSLDGVFLAALAKLQLRPAGPGTSCWAEGIGDANHASYIPNGRADDAGDNITR